jgi:hypothetical protein
VRVYLDDFRTKFHDVREPVREWSAIHAPDDYSASRAFGRRLLEVGSNGITYRSVRDPTGDCLACFRPPLVNNVRAGGHYELTWTGTPEPTVRRVAMLP